MFPGARGDRTRAAGDETYPVAGFIEGAQDEPDLIGPDVKGFQQCVAFENEVQRPSIAMEDRV
jgi:hypothetical protein